MSGTTPGGAGFTLAELVLALTLAALIAGSVVLLLLGQDRFYDSNGAAISARQSLRATADLFDREVRGAAGSDLMAARADSVTLRSDLLRGVVCSAAAGTVTYFVYASPPANLSGIRGTAVTLAYDSVTSYDDDWDGSGATASADQRAACQAAGSPTSAAPSSYRSTAWTGTTLPFPERGTGIWIYAPLTYRVAPSTFATGLAIWREGQELAAPFGEAGFSYVLSDGSRAGSVDPGGLGSVERVVLEMAVAGRDPGLHLEHSLSYEVVLRN